MDATDKQTAESVAASSGRRGRPRPTRDNAHRLPSPPLTPPIRLSPPRVAADSVCDGRLTLSRRRPRPAHAARGAAGGPDHPRRAHQTRGRLRRLARVRLLCRGAKPARGGPRHDRAAVAGVQRGQVRLLDAGQGAAEQKGQQQPREALRQDWLEEREGAAAALAAREGGRQLPRRLLPCSVVRSPRPLLTLPSAHHLARRTTSSSTSSTPRPRATCRSQTRCAASS